MFCNSLHGETQEKATPRNEKDRVAIPGPKLHHAEGLRPVAITAA